MPVSRCSICRRRRRLVRWGGWSTLLVLMVVISEWLSFQRDGISRFTPKMCGEGIAYVVCSNGLKKVDWMFGK
jgi:hypothetical protein